MAGRPDGQGRPPGEPVLLDVVAGHRRDNLQHELELGDAGVTSPRAVSVVRNALTAAERARSPRAGRSRPGRAGRERR
jgi:hypothetical protein